MADMGMKVAALVGIPLVAGALAWGWSMQASSEARLASMAEEIRELDEAAKAAEARANEAAIMAKGASERGGKRTGGVQDRAERKAGKAAIAEGREERAASREAKVERREAKAAAGTEAKAKAGKAKAGKKGGRGKAPTQQNGAAN